MKTRGGFTLIESMVYTLLTLLLTILVTTFLFEYWHAMTVSHDRLLQAVERWSMYECFSQDVEAAQPHTLFCSPSHQECIMRVGSNDVGWIFKKDALYRCVGTYNYGLQVWTSKTKARVLDQVKNVIFNRHTGTHQSYVTVQFSYEHAGKKERYEIPLAEGIGEYEEA